MAGEVKPSRLRSPYSRPDAGLLHNAFMDVGIPALTPEIGGARVGNPSHSSFSTSRRARAVRLIPSDQHLMPGSDHGDNFVGVGDENNL
jgi:hypothetical protein